MGGEDQQSSRWIEQCWEPFVSEHPERNDSFQSGSGIPIAPLYSRDSNEAGPGEFPFTRGIHPSMYRGRIWTMRQYAGYSSPSETNQRFRFLLEQGQTGLSVAFDLPTQIGYDSDDPQAMGEVGRVGVPISTVDDLDDLLEGIGLDSVSISMTINSTAPLLLAMLLAVAKRHGISADQIRGTLQNDILKEYSARGTQRFPVEASMRLVVDVIEYCANEVPAFYPISISGYHIREAGSTATQEIAFTLANGIAYLEACRDRGLDLVAVGRRLSFFFNAHNQFFEEVAKFRAARRIWARICRDRFGIEDDRACQLRFHTQTGGSTLQAVEPANNIVRVTLQALSAVLGGTQSLHTNGWDEALSLPSEEAARLALRTQQVIASESAVTDTADPLGGSPFIEELTDQMDRAASDIIQEIDERGGMLRSIEDGFVRNAIEQSAYEAQVARDSGETLPVGSEEGGEIPEAPFHVDPVVEQQRTERLKLFKENRDLSAVESAITQLKKDAQGSVNLMPSLIHAMESGCTLGEVSSTLASVFGEYQDHG